jgi:hypothetical protein
MKKFKTVKLLVESAPSNYTEIKITLEEVKELYLALEYQCAKKLIAALEETEDHFVSVLAQPDLYQWQRSLNERELFKVRAEINRLKASIIKVEYSAPPTG